MSKLKESIADVEDTYEKKIVFLSNLKKSVLQKAFAGELT